MRFRFILYRKVWFGISLALILIGLVSLGTRGLNFGIDFVGGIRFEMELEEATSEMPVREVLAAHGMGDAEIQLIGADRRTVSIRSRALPGADERQALYQDLEAALGSFSLTSLDEVMPVIGTELQRQGLMAIGLASILMVAYISYRFEFKFGVVAIATALHDVLLALGLFSLLWLEIDTAFIAAILTIVGYSINDTIVIFDRIRENLKYRKKESLSEVVDTGINQTLSRSINTSATTLLAVSALLVFGSATIRDFSLALIIGILAGTYSSIFVASPLWVTWQEWSHNRLASR